MELSGIFLAQLSVQCEVVGQKVVLRGELRRLSEDLGDDFLHEVVREWDRVPAKRAREKAIEKLDRRLVPECVLGEEANLRRILEVVRHTVEREPFVRVSAEKRLSRKEPSSGFHAVPASLFEGGIADTVDDDAASTLCGIVLYRSHAEGGRSEAHWQRDDINRFARRKYNRTRAESRDGDRERAFGQSRNAFAAQLEHELVCDTTFPPERPARRGRERLLGEKDGAVVLCRFHADRGNSPHGLGDLDTERGACAAHPGTAGGRFDRRSTSGPKQNKKHSDEKQRQGDTDEDLDYLEHYHGF